MAAFKSVKFIGDSSEEGRETVRHWEDFIARLNKVLIGITISLFKLCIF